MDKYTILTIFFHLVIELMLMILIITDKLLVMLSCQEELIIEDLL